MTHRQTRERDVTRPRWRIKTYLDSYTLSYRHTYAFANKDIDAYAASVPLLSSYTSSHHTPNTEYAAKRKYTKRKKYPCDLVSAKPEAATLA